MVVHFCTEESQRIAITGENSKYLEQLEDLKTTPIIFEK